MGRILCIINPASRDGYCGKQWPKAKEALVKDGWEVEGRLTEKTGDAANFAWESRNEEWDIVVAVGGDGCASEVAAGLRGGDVPMGIIPLGSGDDLARTHGIPRRDIPGALEVLKNGRDRHVPAIRLEGFPAEALSDYPAPKPTEWDGEAREKGRVVRWVFQESDAGVTSAVSRSKLTRGKWIRGTMKYTYLGVVTILGWKKRWAFISYDDEELRLENLTVSATTIGETFGGGYKVCPRAHPYLDGMTTVHGFGLSKSQMLRLMGPMHKGKHIGKWGIEKRVVNKLEILPKGEDGEPSKTPIGPPIWTQSDGEPLFVAPSALEFHPKQLWLRGASVLEWDSSTT